MLRRRPAYTARDLGPGSSIPRHRITYPQTGGRFDPPDGQVLFQATMFRDVDFGGARFFYFTAKGTVFEGCDFTGATFESGFLGSVDIPVFRKCTFARTDLRAVDPGIARFENCVFDEARIRDWHCDCTEFVRCRFRGDIVGSRFLGRPWGAFAGRVHGRKVNEFVDNDFRDARLIDCTIGSGLDVHRQVWPVEDPDFVILDDWPARASRARTVFSSWPDGEARRDAILILGIYTEGFFAGQPTLVVRRSDPGVASEHAAMIWQVLEAPL